MLKLLATLSFIVLAAFPFASAQSIENATIEREEYAVYSAMIVDYVYEENGTFVILNPTSNWPDETKLKDLQFFFPEAPPVALLQETLDDFVQRNKSNRWLTPKLAINRKYILVDRREIDMLINDRDLIGPPDYGWSPFLKKYSSSRGYVTLSRVGFNRQMDQALVHAGWRCPSLCGHWSFLLLVKQNGVWKVVGEANRIVS
jgi:hypothetical protein